MIDPRHCAGIDGVGRGDFGSKQDDAETNGNIDLVFLQRQGRGMAITEMKRRISKHEHFMHASIHPTTFE